MMRRVVAITTASLAAFGAAGCTEIMEGPPTSTLVAPTIDTTVPPFTTPPTTELAPPTTPPATMPTESTVPPETAPPSTFPLPGDIFNPDCVVQVQPGDSLSLIASRLEGVSVADLMAENGIAHQDQIFAFDPLDVCPDGIDDLVTGQPRVAPTTVPPTTEPLAPETTAPPAPTVPPELPSGIEAQQTKLNELLSPLGMPALEVDGISGSRTDQQLCAARLALGLPISRADMEPGGEEERLLMSVAALPLPAADAVGADKWGVVDQTCQVAFFGEGDTSLAFVFPTSTGVAEYPTRNGTNQVLRYDPALENNGWHDSTLFPASGDNPLNGNMYKPLYFDRGQAIHGANNVPLEPASHGCARLRVSDQDRLVEWLGLASHAEQTFSLGDIVEFKVTTQGSY